MDQLISFWLKYSVTWWCGIRRAMLGIGTNNCVEYRHRILNYDYLTGAKKHRTDYLVYMLLHEILPNYRNKIARVLCGLYDRTLSKTEKYQPAKFDALKLEDNQGLVQLIPIPVGDDQFSGAISVYSFASENKTLSQLV